MHNDAVVAVFSIFAAIGNVEIYIVPINTTNQVR